MKCYEQSKLPLKCDLICFMRIFLYNLAILFLFTEISPTKNKKATNYDNYNKRFKIILHKRWIGTLQGGSVQFFCQQCSINLSSNLRSCIDFSQMRNGRQEKARSETTTGLVSFYTCVCECEHGSVCENQQGINWCQDKRLRWIH